MAAPAGGAADPRESPSLPPVATSRADPRWETVPEGLADDAPTHVKGRPHRWYGWQTLLVDTASIGLLVAGAVSESSALETTGFGMYVFGGPVVHGFHGRADMVLLDGGVRFGAPALLGSTGYILESSNCGSLFCGFAGLGAGIVAGMVTAITLDAAVLAREPSPVKPGSAAITGIAPMVDVRSGTTGLAVTGLF
jgi:hypothetical protein